MTCRSRFSVAVAAFILVLSGSAHADDSSNVRVHIESPVPVELERRASANAAWETACGSPCDRDLPRAHHYRFLYGRGLAPGEAFTFRDAPDGTVLLKVHPASKAGEVGATALVVVGVGLAVLSAAGLYFGLTAANRTCAEGEDQCGLGQGLGALLAVFSAGGLLIGGGLVTGGAFLMKDSGPHMTQKVREPTWSGPQGASTSKPPFFVPLTVSF